jgi:hypothetical protein
VSAAGPRAPAGLDDAALEREARAQHAAGVAHHQAQALHGGHDDGPHTGQRVHVLVAVEEVRPAARHVDETLQLGLELVGQQRGRQAAKMGPGEQRAQAGETRPVPAQRGAQRHALGQVEVQARARGAVMQRGAGMRPARRRDEAAQRRDAALGRQREDAAVDGGALAVVVRADGQPACRRHAGLPVSCATR